MENLDFASAINNDILKHTEPVDFNSFKKLSVDQLITDEHLNKYRIDPREDIKPPEIAWEIVNDKTDTKSTLGTLGNFSVFTGKAKARKSFMVGIAVSTAISKESILNRFLSHLSDNNNKVLYFDTEQGKYHVQLALKRVCKQARVREPKNLEVFGLRSLSPKERELFIDYAIKTIPNLGMVIIDGIKDLVTSINDEEQATMISSKLLKWSEEKNIHIITVLHQNKSDNNARGHIGTELINKAETVLSITKSETDPNISIVEAQQCRNIEFETFAFEINEVGLPVIAEDFQIRTETKQNRADILDLEDYKKFKILIEVYTNGESFKYSELVIQIQISFKKLLKKSIGQNRIKELITYCKNQDWLIQDGTKAPYTLGEYSN